MTIRRFIFSVAILCFVSPVLFSQNTSYTFTECGALGPVGPTQAQINAAYAGANPLNGQVTTTNGIQQWTVTNGGLYRIQVWGAQGGCSGGLGAFAQGEFTINPGVLSILVGQTGSVAPNNVGNGGGGGSYVVAGNTPLIIAGGGGGTAHNCSNGNYAMINGTTSTSGMIGQFAQAGLGGTNGGGGGFSTSTGNNTPNGGGGGGFSGNGGTSGNAQGGMAFVNGGAGGSSTGGFGGGGGSNLFIYGCGSSPHGGCGGGGYSGGGAGGSNCNGAGGGGGSYNVGVNQINTSGVNSGNGRVIITRLCSISMSVSTPNGINAICAGQSVTLTTNAVSGISWSTGGTGTSVVVSPNTTTTYSVIGTSSANCVASSALQLTVNTGVPNLTVSTSGNSICFGQAVTLTGSGALTYTWVNGNVNGQAFTPSVSATYTLLGQNGCGTSTALTNVTVAPLQVAAISSSSVICASTPATLTAAAAATGYTWQPVGQTGANIVVSPSATTVYTVTVTNGTCGGFATVTVSTNPNPTLSISASSSVACQGSPVSMTVAGANSYTWYPGSLSGATYTAYPTAPTLYSVAGTNSFGCVSWANQVVLTSNSPTVTINASNTLICAGTTVSLTAGGAGTYSWNTGATTAQISDTPSTTSVYTVFGNANGCTGTKTIQINVFNPMLSISGPSAVCAGKSATLSASAADSYTWSTGSPFSSITITPSVNTIYTLTASTSSGNLNCPSAASISIAVNPLPTVTAIASKTSVCKGQTFTLTASGAQSYTWNTGVNAATVVTSSSLIANVNFTVTGMDANGCTNAAVIVIKVNSCIGIDEWGAEQIQIFPNPGKGLYQIELPEFKGIQIRVSNALGQELLHISAQAEQRIDLTRFNSGIYTLSIYKDHTMVHQRLLIKN